VDCNSLVLGGKKLMKRLEKLAIAMFVGFKYAVDLVRIWM